MNTAEFLEISSYAVPDRTAVVSGATRLTYMQLADRVSRLAAALLHLGLRRGSRVAVMAVNSHHYVELYYACARLGATLVPLNYRAKQEELSYMINTAEATVLAVDERYLGLLGAIRSQLVSLQTVICFDSPSHGTEGDGAGDVQKVTMLGYEALIAESEPEEISVAVDDADPTILMYTSGTTALPKGVVLSYLDLTAYVINTMEPASDATSGVTLISVPIYHIAGMTAIMSSIWGGRTLVLLPQFEPRAWLEAVQTERVTHSFIVPTMLKRVMDDPDFARYDLSSLQLVAYGAAPMPFEVVRRAVEVFDCGLMNAYGQTESTSAITYLGPEDHQIRGLTGEALEQRLRRLRSVGRPMDDVAVAIMDEQNEILESGREGEICVAGARVMSGYFKQDAATHEAIVDGWLHTGDVGYLDKENYLFITGRKKDLIIRGGENISPGEIEATLSSHPAIDDAAVIGVPDAEWGEVVKAICVLKRGAEATPNEIIQYCRAHLASFKAPAYVTFVPELPRSVVGKVLKTDLRREYGQARSGA